MSEENMSEIQRLQEQIDEVEEYLPAATGPYQTLGERAKLLKDQMEYAAECYGEAVRRIGALQAENSSLSAVLESCIELLNALSTARLEAAVASAKRKEQL